jgi:hypothetical protein
MTRPRAITLAAVWLAIAANPFAQTPNVRGVVRDETGGALPGVSVELKGGGRSAGSVVTDVLGTYRFDRVTPGHYQIGFALINFATTRRVVTCSRQLPPSIFESSSGSAPSMTTGSADGGASRDVAGAGGRSSTMKATQRHLPPTRAKWTRSPSPNIT